MPQDITSKDITNNTQMEFGNVSVTYTASATELKNAGMYIYAIQPLGGNATISSAKDIAGNAVTALAGIIYTQDVVYIKQLQSITFSALTGVEIFYKTPTQ